MTEGEAVRFEHGGTVWEVPAGLVGLQRSWFAADDAVHALAEGDDRDGLRLAREHRLELTMSLYEDAWLLQAMADGRRYQADMALKACARTRPA
jgi:hypothetical protein